MKKIEITADLISKRKLDQELYYYQEGRYSFIPIAAESLKEPGNYYVSQFIYYGGVFDIADLIAIDEMVLSGAMKGKTDKYEFERQIIKPLNKITYEIKLTALNRG